VDLGVTLREFSDWLKEHGGSASGYTPPAVAVTRISSQIPWDVCSVSFQECCDAPLMAAIFNVDGRLLSLFGSSILVKNFKKIVRGLKLPCSDDCVT
jgi:hypothetical protein